MKRQFCLMTVLVLLSAGGNAQNLGTTFQLTPYFNLHGYVWKEFEDNGNEVLKESGPRFSFGTLSRLSFLQKKNLYVEMDLQYVFGTVDYQGFTFDLQTGQRQPYTTQTAYWSFSGMISAGYIFLPGRTFHIAPIAGFGYEVWNRDISNGGPLGYDELYSVILGHVGVNCTYVTHAHFQIFGGVTLKVPFSISETIDRFPRGQSQKFNIDISPGINPRFAVHVGGSVYGVFALLDFETWTLSKSVESQGLHQPESTRTQFGIKLGYTISVL